MNRDARTRAVQQAVRVVTCTKLKDTGRISYIFLFNSKSPEAWMNEGFTDVYGILRRDKKSDNHLDPFKMARVQSGELPRETQFVGDDGVARWNVNLFNSDGFVLGCGWDDNGPEAMATALEGWPERCTILMRREDYEPFEKACKALCIDVQVLHVDGELSTS